MRTRSSPLGYFRRAAKSGEGRLWFAVFEGVAVVDPSHLIQNRFPPPVKIEAITADHTAFPVGANVKLPPLTRDLQIDYTAFSYVAPEKVRFRYKLAGFDPESKHAGGRRPPLDTNLPPRPYRANV